METTERLVEPPLDPNLPPPSTATWTAEAAYEHTRAEMVALTEAQLLVVNLDVPTAVARVLAAVPRLRAIEEQIAARWHAPASGQVDRLERYAWALQYAHCLCQGLKAVQPDASQLVRELAGMRQRILCCIRALAVGGAVDLESFQAYQHVKSHRSLVRSVSGIVSVCSAQWADLQNKTPLTKAELDQAFALAVQLSVLLQSKNGASEPLSAALRERQRVFTLLIHGYTALRRAAQFLYPRREAERRVPSLYRKSPGARRTASAVANVATP